MNRYGFRILVMVLMVFWCFPLLAQDQDDLQTNPSCQYCGKDRRKFSHSRMVVHYNDGTSTGTCSLRCTAVDLAVQIDKSPKTIQVGDYLSKSLIDAEKAFWIIQGSKMGVMTNRAKWAFEKKEEAEQFMAANGGDLFTFKQAIKAAYEDLYQDTNTSRGVRVLRKKGMTHDNLKRDYFF